MATAQRAVVRGTDSDQSPRGKQQAAGQIAGAGEQSVVAGTQIGEPGQWSGAEQSRGRAGVVTEGSRAEQSRGQAEVEARGRSVEQSGTGGGRYRRTEEPGRARNGPKS